MAILIVMALPWLYTFTSSPQDIIANKPETLSQPLGSNQPKYINRGDSLVVSVITCFPGPEIYELCGHSAIRVRGEGIDSVWNFGIFNFNEPNFVYRFVKGETDYMCAGYPFAWFLPEYVERGSKVVEQDLNFSQEEAQRMLGLLREGALPENRRYRYNYVKDNCSTRILDRMDDASEELIIYPDSVSYGTFRNEMRAYHKNYPWYQFGIDLALGSGLDYKLMPREEMFVPVEMMKKVGEGHFADGRPLVRATRVLNEGKPDATLAATQWWQAPQFCSWLLFTLTLIICMYCLTKVRIVRFYFALWFSILGLAGLLLAFLIFVSAHEATSPNCLFLWLNPFQFLFVIGVLWRRLRPLAVAMAYYNVIAMLALLVVWPFQVQSANPAFFPLMGATLLLGASYAIIRFKISYNNKK